MKKILIICFVIATPVLIFFLAERAVAPSNPEVSTDSRINISSPKAGSTVESPLVVSGEARGTWYFEASFPIKILDKNGAELAVVPAQAQGEWMTEEFVPFSATIDFSGKEGESGFVVFKRDNPSGLPENDAEVRIPVLFGPQKIKVLAFFGNTTKGSNEDCSKVFPATRYVAKTEAVASVALGELLKGLTENEKEVGSFTSINEGVKIQKLSIENGVASVDFSKALDESIGGSCRVANIRAQIENTLLQFPTVKEVIISVDGRSEDILQP